MASKKDDEVEVFSRMDEDGFFEQYGEDEEIILEHPDEGVVSASEESWGDEDEPMQVEPVEQEVISDEEGFPEDGFSDSESYSLISEGSYDKTSWVDIAKPIANRSDSVDSSWEVLSLADSIDAVSLCSVNDLARRAIEEHLMNEKIKNFSAEPCLDEKNETTEKISQALTEARTVHCGLVLFRKAGAEVACIKKKTRTITTPVGKIKKGESPLEAAVRAFKKKTGCENFDAFAILSKVIQIPEENQLILLFPALIERELFFSPNEKTSQFEWYSTHTVANEFKKSANKRQLSNIVQEAYGLLVQYRHELPNIVNDVVAQTLDVGTYQLFDFVLENEKAIEFHEIKTFLSANHEDLQRVLEGCGEKENEAMLRKLILQLPHSGISDEIPEPAILEQYGVHYDNATPVDQLEHILLNNFGDNGINWNGMKRDLRESPCSIDETIRDTLVQAGWDVRTLKFTNKTIEAKIQAQEMLFTAVSILQGRPTQLMI